MKSGKSEGFLICPKCKIGMEKIKSYIGYGIDVYSLQCRRCGFNVTDEKVLNTALGNLKEQMTKEVKLLR